MTLISLILIALALIFSPLWAAMPDESLWSSFLSALTMLAALGALGSLGHSRRGDFSSSFRRASYAFSALLALALLSVLFRIAVHGKGFIDPMLRAFATLATDFALFILAYHHARQSRAACYVLLLAAFAGSAMAASSGVQEFLTHALAHDFRWRVFGTSTPDYLAAYLVMLLPVTLALFLNAPSAQRIGALFGLVINALFAFVIVLQLLTLLSTQSRFALVSLALSLIVLAAGLVRATRSGLRMQRHVRLKLIATAVLILLPALAVSGPVIHRLRHNQENSGAFRVWTWRGSIHMAEKNPLLGTGIGTYVYTYPRYAYTGFTRMAHNSYLQFADECGAPALIVFLALLGIIGAAIWDGLGKAPGPEVDDDQAASSAPSHPIEYFTGPDDIVPLCGILAGLTAAMVQNLIDSDWYVYFFSTAFWTLAGLGLALAPTRAAETETVTAPETVTGSETIAEPVLRRALLLPGVAATAVLLFTLTGGIAAFYALQAQESLASRSINSASDAEEAFSNTLTWDPLNGHALADLGYKIDYLRQNNLPAAEATLRSAIALEPSSVNYSRLGNILHAEGRSSDAIAAYRHGLTIEPNSLDILLDLAAICPPDQAQAVFRRIAELEDSPVGKVRAIGEITESRFAIADSALGDAANAAKNAQNAAYYYQRANRLLEAYADEGGTSNLERQVLIGGHPNPEMDQQMQSLYAHVTAELIKLAPTDQQNALLQRQNAYLQKFAQIVKDVSKPSIH